MRETVIKSKKERTRAGEEQERNRERKKERKLRETERTRERGEEQEKKLREMYKTYSAHPIQRKGKTKTSIQNTSNNERCSF